MMVSTSKTISKCSISTLYCKTKVNFFSTAFVGSFSYAHTVFILSDPPDWTCADLNVIQCRENVEGDYFNPKGSGHIEKKCARENFSKV